MKKTIYIQGMHCASCEIVIKNAVQEIKGLKVHSISATKGILDVEYDHEKGIEKATKSIKELGYKVVENQSPSQEKINRKHLGIAVGIVAIVLVIFYSLHIDKHIPSMSGSHRSIGLAVLMGIIASVSTCFAIVGSIVIGFSHYFDHEKGTANHVKTQLSFHLGRIVGFFILGGLLGLLGQAIAISLTVSAILTIVVGIIVVWMGLHLLGILPNISTLGIHLPKSRTEKSLAKRNPLFAPLIGLLTFFIPCGFTLSMQLVAVSTGSFRSGGLVMAFFALGTFPVLFAVGLGSSYIKEKKFQLLHYTVGVFVLFFGVFMVTNAWRLQGGISGLTNNQTDIQQPINTAYEKVQIGHDGWSTVPGTIKLKAGKNYELTILPSENGKGCMVSLLIPKLDRTVHPIIKNQPITYKFTNLQEGRYNIVCGTMGMYQGQLLVE